VTSLRLALTIVALLAPLLAIAPSRETRMPTPPLESSLPVRVGSWALAARHALPEDVLQVVRPADYAMWQYAAPDRPPIDVYVATYGRLRDLGAGAHDPRLCYPAQGWSVLSTAPISVPLAGSADGATVEATLLHAQLGDRHELVLYWVQPATRWPSAHALEQLLVIRDAAIGEDRYAFVRLAVPVGATGDQTVDLQDFARELAPLVRGLLEVSVAGAGQGAPSPAL
jgi:EpsI family protein